MEENKARKKRKRDQSQQTRQTFLCVQLVVESVAKKLDCTAIAGAAPQTNEYKLTTHWRKLNCLPRQQQQQQQQQRQCQVLCFIFVNVCTRTHCPFIVPKSSETIHYAEFQIVVQLLNIHFLTLRLI